jgi:hypothetical protein
MTKYYVIHFPKIAEQLVAECCLNLLLEGEHPDGVAHILLKCKQEEAVQFVFDFSQANQIGLEEITLTSIELQPLDNLGPYKWTALPMKWRPNNKLFPCYYLAAAPVVDQDFIDLDIDV